MNSIFIYFISVMMLINNGCKISSSNISGIEYYEMSKRCFLNESDNCDSINIIKGMRLLDVNEKSEYLRDIRDSISTYYGNNNLRFTLYSVDTIDTEFYLFHSLLDNEGALDTMNYLSIGIAFHDKQWVISGVIFGFDSTIIKSGLKEEDALKHYDCMNNDLSVSLQNLRTHSNSISYYITSPRTGESELVPSLDLILLEGDPSIDSNFIYLKEVFNNLVLDFTNYYEFRLDEIRQSAILYIRETIHSDLIETEYLQTLTVFKNREILQVYYLNEKGCGVHVKSGINDENLKYILHIIQ